MLDTNRGIVRIGKNWCDRTQTDCLHNGRKYTLTFFHLVMARTHPNTIKPTNRGFAKTWMFAKPQMQDGAWMPIRVVVLDGFFTGTGGWTGLSTAKALVQSGNALKNCPTSVVNTCRKAYQLFASRYRDDHYLEENLERFGLHSNTDAPSNTLSRLHRNH